MTKTDPQTSDTIEAPAAQPESETNPPAGEMTPSSGEAAALDLEAIAAQHPVDEADDPDLETEYRTRRLDRAMTDEERMTIGQEMADALAEAESLEARKKEVDNNLKTSIDYQYEKAGNLAQALRKGMREGSVEVKVTKNWHNGSITVTRPDTGETLEERAMTFDERQRTLLNGDETTEAVGGDSTDADPEDHEYDEVEDREMPETQSVSPAEALAMTAGKAGHA